MLEARTGATVRPGQLFARILDINPSGSNWCFYVAANVPSPSVRMLLPWSLSSGPQPPVSREHHCHSCLMTWGPAQSLRESRASRSSGRSLGWESGDLVYIPGNLGQGLGLLGASFSSFVYWNTSPQPLENYGRE